MQTFLQQLIVDNFFAFMLVFMRFGMAMSVMPGIGDSFVPTQIRMLFILSVSFILTPALSSMLPPMPKDMATMAIMILAEGTIGLFIGTAMRLMLSALDVAGSVISAQTGLSSAVLFNPTTEAQGSILSALYSSVGVTLLLTSGLYGQMLASLADSYNLYPPVLKDFPSAGDLSETIIRIIIVSFKTGVGMALPFLVVGTLVQVGFGMLGRLMPQVQVFFLAMPLQILASFIMLAGTLSVGILYWFNSYQDLLSQTLVSR